jgi:polysaccharide export outer membrane protein
MLHKQLHSIARVSAVLAASLLFPAVVALGQEPQGAPQPQASPPAAQSAPSGYVLGTNDVISIHAPDLGEASDKAMRIPEEGYIVLPQMGRIRASGLTVSQLEQAIVEKLSPFVRSPQVMISIIQFRSESVYLIGAFVKPGTYPYQPNRRLSELLSIAGGLSPSANRRVKVTRQLEFGRIPLRGAVEDSDRGVSEVEIDVRRLIANIGSPEDLVLQPSDVIAATLREKIYVSGMVARPGALELDDRDSITVTQAIAIAGLSPIEDTNRRAKIPVNVKKILQGEATDFPLLPNDVLVIPQKRSLGKKAATYGLPVAGIAASLLYVFLN